jgi:hypothetical protein
MGKRKVLLLSAQTERNAKWWFYILKDYIRLRWPYLLSTCFYIKSKKNQYNVDLKQNDQKIKFKLITKVKKSNGHTRSK